MRDGEGNGKGKRRKEQKNARNRKEREGTQMSDTDERGLVRGEVEGGERQVQELGYRTSLH